jgi:hypothetical protein
VDALEQQVRDLAATLRAAASGRARPDIVGLCEVGDEALGRRVAEALGRDAYHAVWSGVPRAGAVSGPDTGLMVLYRPEVVRRALPEIVTDRPSPGARHKWLAVPFQLLAGSRAPFWLVVNHWTSQFGGGEATTEPSRRNSARELGRFFLDTARITTEAMVLVGDFNCEPPARPFVEQSPNQMKGVRERALVLRERNRLAYFYNPMWRLLGEPHPQETARRPGYRPPRPPGTFARDAERQADWALWDQILVTKPLLSGELIRFVENGLRVVPPKNGASDHCAIGAVFEG